MISSLPFRIGVPLHRCAQSSLAYILVRDDLDILDVSRSLKDLAQDILSHALVQAADVESSLVGLRSRAPSKGGGAGGRHEPTLVAAPQRRRDRGRDGVCILRDVEGRRRHMGGLAILVIEPLATSVLLLREAPLHG